MDLEQWDQGKFGAIPLNGQWKILWHQLLNLEDFAQLDAHFLNGESFSLPSYWNTKQEQVAKSGFGFASFILQLKNIPKISGSYSIYQAKFVSSGKLSVYCPQQLGKPHWLIEAGRLSQTAELEVPSLARSHVQLDLAGQGSCYVVVIVSNYSHRNGGLNLPIFFGDKNFITKNIYLRRISNYSLIAVFLIIMFYNLALFLQRTEDHSSLWLSVFCLFVASRSFVMELYPDFFSTREWAFALKYRLEYLTIMGLPLSLTVFWYYCFPNHVSRTLIKYYALAALGLILITFTFPPATFTKNLMIYQCYILFSACYLPIVLIKAYLNKEPIGAAFKQSIVEIFSSLAASASSRIMIRSAISNIVTSAPKRRSVCAISEPMGPEPMTAILSGNSVCSKRVTLVR